MSHVFTKSEIRQAEHEFQAMIEKYFGEVWKIAWNGEYKGCDWFCNSMLIMDAGLWRLCQYALHKGAKRAAGRIEVRDAGETLRFVIFYDTAQGDTPRLLTQ